jgi:hypothetical protein
VQPEKGPVRYAAIFLLGGAAVLTISWVQLRLTDGMRLSLDGWEYWEGSVGLLRGCGHVYFGGQPILTYPPLYASYLAGVQALLGVSVASLVWATALLGGVSAAAWTALYLAINPGWRRAPLLALAIAGFFVARSVTNSRALLSETLLMPLLALALFALVRAHADSERRDDSRRALAALALATTAILFCRNAAIVFLPGLALVIGRRHRGSHGKDLMLRVGAAVVLPLTLWLGYRAASGQLASHAVSGPTLRSPGQYLVELAQGIPAELGPEAVGWLLFAAAVGAIVVLLRSLARTTPWWTAVDVLCIAGLGVVGTYLLFNLTFVHDPLNGRFLMWLPGCLVIALGSLAREAQATHRRLYRVSLVIIGLAILPQAPLPRPIVPTEQSVVREGSIWPGEAGLWTLVREPIPVEPREQETVVLRRGGSFASMQAIDGCNAEDPPTDRAPAADESPASPAPRPRRAGAPET